MSLKYISHNVRQNLFFLVIAQLCETHTHQNRKCFQAPRDGGAAGAPHRGL